MTTEVAQNPRKTRKKNYRNRVADVPPADLSQPSQGVEGIMSIFGCSKNTAYALLRNGSLPTLRLGSHYRVPTSALLDLLRNGGKLQPKP